MADYQLDGLRVMPVTVWGLDGNTRVTVMAQVGTIDYNALGLP